MNYTERESAPPPVPPLMPSKIVVNKWYLKGFGDGYRGRRAVILSWSAREQYKKGYAEGLDAARSDFSEAIRD